MNREEIRIRIQYLRKKIKFNSLITSNKKFENEIKWMQRLYLSVLNQIEYELEYSKNIYEDVSNAIQSLIEWYESDTIHPIKIIPVEIKDVFWGCFEYIIGQAEFEKRFKKQIFQFYNENEYPDLSINKINFKSESNTINPSSENIDLIKKYIETTNIFNIDEKVKELLIIEKYVRKFCQSILDFYSKGKLTQKIFSKNYGKLMMNIDEEYEFIDSEDRDDLEEYLTNFSNLFGLNLI